MNGPATKQPTNDQATKNPPFNQPHMDVYCLSDCGDAELSGQQRWTPLTMVEVQQWPTFKYASANPFQNKKQRKQLAKQRSKLVRATLSTRREEGTKVTVVSNSAQDSAASLILVVCPTWARCGLNQCVWPSCTCALL